MNYTDIELLGEKIRAGYRITVDEASALAATKEVDKLCEEANKIRMHFSGNHMDLCSITNAKSGKCSENCKWCAQSAHYKVAVDVYDIIDAQTAVIQAKANEAKGVHKYSLVTSGKTMNNSQIDKLVDIFTEIRKNSSIRLCASMGLLNKDQLLKLKGCGVEHYHCNLETAPSYFSNLCTTHSIEDKIATIKSAQEAGLGICSGGIIGMGESMEHRIELAFILRDLGVKSIPINILQPIEGTPLEGTEALSDEEILKTFALFRFINPEAKIRFAGGRMKIKHMEDKVLMSGVNASLVGDLLTTIGSDIDMDKNNFSKAGFTF